MLPKNYTDSLNRSIVRELIDLDGQIREEKDKAEIDRKRIAELRAKRIMRGIEMNTGYIRTNNNQPY